MRTAEEIREQFNEECAKRAEVKTVTYGSPHTSQWDKKVDKQSILSLINELK